MSFPMPQPSAFTMSLSSLFSSTFLSDACSALSTLPRSGQDRLRLPIAALASPSPGAVAFHDEELGHRGSDELQSASLPGRLRRLFTADLRRTCSVASRDASRAFAAMTMRVRIASACDL
jgi:hypothetical protein